MKLKQFAPDIKIADFRPSSGFREYIRSSLYWIIPSFLGVLIIYCLSQYRSTYYLNKALDEGISPQLWNVIGSIGFLFFGLSILCLPFNRFFYALSRIATKLLLITFEMGLLTFGIILGKMTIAFNITPLQTWQAWFFTITLWLLVVLVFVLNSLIWFAARIIDNASGAAPILKKASNWHWTIRLLICLFFTVIPILFLLLER